MVTVVPFNGNDRFFIGETEFPLRKHAETCCEGRGPVVYSQTKQSV